MEPQLQHNSLSRILAVKISPRLLWQLQRLYTLLCSAFTDTLDRFSLGLIPSLHHK